MDWRKSSFSSAQGGQCIEVASSDDVTVRDTADRDGTTLTFSTEAWATFVTQVRS
jgi:hypothetical protein